LRCLYCGKEQSSRNSWLTVFRLKEEPALCLDCQEQFQRISGDRCSICGRPVAEWPAEWPHANCCLDCVRWQEDENWRNVLTKNVSLFYYNEGMKEWLARFKYRGDYHLARCFASEIRAEIQLMAPDKIVPIPLSKERLKERGFNQAKALVEEAGFVAEELLGRIHTEKQSKKSRTERIHLPEVFYMIRPESLDGETVLLVDDIYTTGSTLRHAAKVLKNQGAHTVLALTLARG
jgi:competence protein ComFC